MEQDQIDDQAAQPSAVPELREPPTEPDELANKWARRIEKARKDASKFHKRIAHNRKLVSGFDWTKDPNANDFYTLRANLIHGTITAILPQIYARNPEINVAPRYKAPELKLFCKTLQQVTNAYLEMAKLKERAKMTVRSSLTCSYGVVKLLYQKDVDTDLLARTRMNDVQDNIKHVEGLAMRLDDPDSRADQKTIQAELNDAMQGINAATEVTVAEGLVIDRVLTENLLIDPAITEFTDYPDAGWMCHIIPMSRGKAEELYKYKLKDAKTYSQDDSDKSESTGFASGKSEQQSDDDRIAVLEIWDKVSQRVYTMVDGCKFFVREPFSPPKAGARWFPFFLLPYQLVDGTFVAPSLVDLTEKLQKEHNDARDKFNAHRDLNKPGYVGSAEEVTEKSVKRFTDAQLGEVTLIETQGKPLSQVFMPRVIPPIDPAMYDTTQGRQDWEQVTGVQDAMRSTVVNAKTATEASIMQQALSGRVSEFRDQTEDWLQDIAQYAAQILLQELSPAQVERIMGPHVTQTDPATGMPVTVERAYDWPELARDEIFSMVQMKIRAGTTGAPDKLEMQEAWGKLLPTIMQLVQAIQQLQAQGMDAEPQTNMLRETLARFDDKLEVEQFLPRPPQPKLPGAAPGMAPDGMAPAAGLPPQIAQIIQSMPAQVAQ